MSIQIRDKDGNEVTNQFLKLQALVDATVEGLVDEPESILYLWICSVVDEYVVRHEGGLQEAEKMLQNTFKIMEVIHSDLRRHAGDFLEEGSYD